MTGQVWDIGYLGNLSIYHVKLDSGKMVTATQANMARLIERPLTWDERVYLTWAPNAAVILLN
jgi:putrescine transport system ATP-binding protein